MNRTANDFAKSDDLLWLIPFLGRGIITSSLFVKFKLIVDANMILADIRWMLKKRQSPEARTCLLELLEARSIECYAPTFMRTEISEQIAPFSKSEGFDPQDATELWSRIEPKIQFLDTGGPADDSENLRDPKDQPYIRLQERIEAPIVTNDKDIAGMGGTVAEYTIIANLRDYARFSAVNLKIMAIGGVSITLPVNVISECVSLLKCWLGSRLSKPSLWVLILGLVLLAALVIFPAIRTWLILQAETVYKHLEHPVRKIVEMLEPAIQMYQESLVKAQFSLAQANDKITAHG